ncbi:WecB/TagA/CpsF family glycosyltransferase [Azoarcus olearius]|uniref:Glycosyltransferase n=1 Tax=Azoarcus sp. (strain BH72) TaxID=418699 RepID=A1K7P5_AZOSB|nr:WecB/TagA/CpsF family glycosyltransferase [Azoarcus olearius]ANQ85397.1 putative glycosyltransferase [Azoarcus olearius]CAL94850.1 putative glycosyltransferase [Azoarcus olearius]
MENTLYLGGFRIRSVTGDDFADELLRHCEARERRRVVFANTNFIVQCRGLRRRLARGSVCVVNDGIGVDLAALLVHGRRFADNLAGSDFIPKLCERSPRPLRFFLLGSRPGVAMRAGQRLVEEYGQEVVGCCDGYDGFAALRESGQLAERINESGADVVLVAFGNPMQEQWMLDHDEAIEAPLMFGVGALLDFLAGEAKRAPEWVRRARLEWLYRLAREPRRLLRRYTLDIVTFLSICLLAGRGAARVGQAR